jgi:hypothetical protein
MSPLAGSSRPARPRPAARSCGRARWRPPARWHQPATAAVLAAAAVLATACGSGHDSGSAGTGPATARLPLATSQGGTAGQPGWAVVEMGGSSATYNNFWELFARPAGAAQWKLATPLGVASNGGLSISSTGTGLVAGFQPSQDLTFSPLAAASTAAADWSQAGAPVTPGLASVPDALAAGPDGQVVALTDTGQVLLGRREGAAWTRLTTRAAIARTAAGRACGLTSLTAVGFTPGGLPMIGGTCTRPGSTGIFEQEQGATVAATLPLPGGPATVLGLAAGTAGHTTALLKLGTGPSATVVAAWLGATAAGTSVSAAMATGAGAPRSLALWSDGGAGLVLAGGRAEAISGPGSTWRALPALPAHAATLALGPAGQLQALAPLASTLTVWQLSAAGTSWTKAQQLKVTVPYGSSG